MLGEKAFASPAQSGDSDISSVVGCGRALPGHRLEVRDPISNRLMNEREIGEICFYGPSVCPAYFHELRDPKGFKARKELRTGDLGYLFDGYLYVVGRLKDVIQIAGANYYPSDVEAFVNKVPGVRIGRSVAIGVQNLKIGTSSLVIVTERDARSDEVDIKDRIKTFVRQNIGITVEEVLFIAKGSMPLTTSGKLMRSKCLELYQRSRET